MNKNQSSLLDEDSRSELSEQQIQIKKGIIARYFGPIQDGSLRGAIFALLASAMGTGIFNLPLRVGVLGIVPYIFFLFLSAIFSYSGMIMMSRLINKYQFLSYSEMAQKAMGHRFMRFAQFCIIFYPWGITICFQVILAKFICQLVNDNLNISLYTDRESEQYNSSGNLCRILINLAVIAISLPFSLQKKMGLLQKLSFLGVASVLYNFLVIVVISLIGFKRTDDGSEYHGIFFIQSSNVNWFTEGSIQGASTMTQGLASIMFCFVSHQLLFPVVIGLARPTQKRMNKIVTRVHCTEIIVYFLIGSLGYLLLLEHQDIHPIGAMVITSIPINIVTVGKLLMIFSLFLAIPMNIFPSRQSIFESGFIQRNNKNHISLTVILSIVSCGIAIGFQQVNSYFGLLGGTAGVMMAGGIPGICYFRLQPKLRKSDSWLLGIIGTVTIVAFVGALLSVIFPV